MFPSKNNFRKALYRFLVCETALYDCVLILKEKLRIEGSDPRFELLSTNAEPESSENSFVSSLSVRFSGAAEF